MIECNKNEKQKKKFNFDPTLCVLYYKCMPANLNFALFKLVVRFFRLCAGVRSYVIYIYCLENIIITKRPINKELIWYINVQYVYELNVHTHTHKPFSIYFIIIITVERYFTKLLKPILETFINALIFCTINLI